MCQDASRRTSCELILLRFEEVDTYLDRVLNILQCSFDDLSRVCKYPDHRKNIYWTGTEADTSNMPFLGLIHDPLMFLGFEELENDNQYVALNTSKLSLTKELQNDLETVNYETQGFLSYSMLVKALYRTAGTAFVLFRNHFFPLELDSPQEEVRLVNEAMDMLVQNYTACVVECFQHGNG